MIRPGILAIRREALTRAGGGCGHTPSLSIGSKNLCATDARTKARKSLIRLAGCALRDPRRQDPGDQVSRPWLPDTGTETTSAEHRIPQRWCGNEPTLHPEEPLDIQYYGDPRDASVKAVAE